MTKNVTIRSQSINYNAYDKRVDMVDVGPIGSSSNLLNNINYLVVPIIREVTNFFTYTNQPAAFGQIGTAGRHVILIPIDGFTQVNLALGVLTRSTVSTSRMKLLYKTGAFSTNILDYVDLAQTGECAATLNTATGSVISESGWINLPNGLSGDIWIMPVHGGGNGIDDPALYSVVATFR